MRSAFSLTRKREKKLSPIAFGNGAGNSAHLQDLVVGLFEQFAERSEGKKPGVRCIEDALFAVVELPEEQHQPGHEETDVRRRENELRPFPTGGEAQLLHEILGRFEVLDDVEHQDLVELRDVDRKFLAIEIPANEFEIVRRRARPPECSGPSR